MSNELIISGIPVKIIEYKGTRVLTTEEMALHHNIPTFRLNEKFRRNKKHFIKDVDYYIVTKKDVSESQTAILNLFVVNNMTEIYLFTESGYLRFVKTINDDKAWEIYGQLVESYFLMKRLNKTEQIFLEKSKENRKGLTSEWKEHGAKDYRYLTVTEYDSLFKDTSIRKRNMDDKQLSLLSAFEFLEHRKLENNTEIKGDKKLSESLISTGKQINNIINTKNDEKGVAKIDTLGGKQFKLDEL